MLTLIGIVFFALTFAAMMRTRAYYWRELAQRYAKEAGPARDERSMRTVVLIGQGAVQSHKGCVTVGAHATGVSFRIGFPILSMFCQPLFIPYRDISGWGTTWYLNARSSELHFRQAPAVKMVLPTEEAEWIRQHAGGTVMPLRDVSPPQGRAGQGWRAFFILQTITMLVVIGFALSTGKVAVFQTKTSPGSERVPD